MTGSLGSAMTLLSVNLNKVALLRNQRGKDNPNVIRAARTAIEAGAGGITVHPRPDGRHIRRHDVVDLKRLIDEVHGGRVELNVEGNPTPAFMALMANMRPAQATLVPDAPDAVTSENGWELPRDAPRLAPLVGELKAMNIRVSIFMDPDARAISRVPKVEADRIELYTGPYAAAFGTAEEDAVFRRYEDAAAAAREAGLGINAGHDLNLENLPRFCTIKDVLEVSIGHYLIADALTMGLKGAIAAYLDALANGDGSSARRRGAQGQ